MMSNYRALICLAAGLAAACASAFAGTPVAATPEPRLGLLVVLGVGAAVLGVRKMKGR
jgi:hypothetical protein